MLGEGLIRVTRAAIRFVLKRYLPARMWSAGRYTGASKRAKTGSLSLDSIRLWIGPPDLSRAYDVNNFRRLQYFVKIVDIGSLTQAAEILHVAQPA